MTKEEQDKATAAELCDIRNWWNDTKTQLAREEALALFMRRVWRRNFKND